MPGEPLSLLLCGLREALYCRNDEHNPSGFDVPEHFREPEFLGHRESRLAFLSHPPYRRSPLPVLVVHWGCSS